MTKADIAFNLLSETKCTSCNFFSECKRDKPCESIQLNFNMIQQGISFPINPEEGMLFINNSTDQLYVYHGLQWIMVGT